MTWKQATTQIARWIAHGKTREQAIHLTALRVQATELAAGHRVDLVTIKDGLWNL